MKTQNQPNLRGFNLRTCNPTKLAIALALSLLTATVQAQFDYTVNPPPRGSDVYTATITGYYGPGGAVTIPAWIGSIRVDGIASSAFAQNTKLTSVWIPYSVYTIGAGAFAFCTNLVGINVASENGSYSSSNGVLFSKSQTALIQVPGARSGSYTIPNSVTVIQWYAFGGCTRLTSVTIPRRW